MKKYQFKKTCQWKKDIRIKNRDQINLIGKKTMDDEIILKTNPKKWSHIK
jgi:hypothetical protein